MIPLRDTHPSRNFPVINTSLIVLNVFIFFVQLSQGLDADRFVYIYGLVPARYSVPHITEYFTVAQQLFSFISFMFLHGGFLHLLGNMWFLHIFGDNVEDHLGPARYLLFYVLTGMASGISHLLLNLHSNVPVIGASGAIAGVMGAYFLLFPRSKVLTLIPIVIIPFFFEIPAFFFLGFWFLMQFLKAAASQGQATGIAWWAHIGGFLFGMIIVKLFDWIPAAGLTQSMQRVTRKKRSHRLHVVRSAPRSDDTNLYGTITVTPHEARIGTRKIVNVPWGFQKRLFRVLVPAGITEGKQLRLRGIGKPGPDGDRGDLLLEVKIR